MSKIMLKSSDGQLFEVEVAVAFMSQVIKHVIEDAYDDKAIPLPNVTSMSLAKVIEYWKKRVESGLTEAAAGEEIKDRGAAFRIWLRLGDQGDWAAEFEGIGDLFYWEFSCGKCSCRECSLMDNIYTTSAAEEAFKNWDAEYLKVDRATLFDIINAADYLNIKGLLNLTSWAVADMIRGMTTKELRNFFNIENDFTPEAEEEVRRENLWASE